MVYRPPFYTPFDSDGAVPATVNLSIDASPAWWADNSQNSDIAASKIVEGHGSEIRQFVGAQRQLCDLSGLDVHRRVATFPDLEISYVRQQGRETIRYLVTPENTLTKVPEEEPETITLPTLTLPWVGSCVVCTGAGQIFYATTPAEWKEFDADGYSFDQLTFDAPSQTYFASANRDTGDADVLWTAVNPGLSQWKNTGAYDLPNRPLASAPSFGAYLVVDGNLCDRNGNVVLSLEGDSSWSSQYLNNVTANGTLLMAMASVDGSADGDATDVVTSTNGFDWSVASRPGDIPSFYAAPTQSYSPYATAQLCYVPAWKLFTLAINRGVLVDYTDITLDGDARVPTINYRESAFAGPVEIYTSPDGDDWTLRFMAGYTNSSSPPSVTVDEQLHTTVLTIIYGNGFPPGPSTTNTGYSGGIQYVSFSGGYPWVPFLTVSSIQHFITGSSDVHNSDMNVTGCASACPPYGLPLTEPYPPSPDIDE